MTPTAPGDKTGGQLGDPGDGEAWAIGAIPACKYRSIKIDLKVAKIEGKDRYRYIVLDGPGVNMRDI
jgi:hypothetical protein